MTTRYLAYVDEGEPVEIVIYADGALEVDGTPIAADIRHISDETIYSMLIENASHEIFAQYQQDGNWIMLVDGERHEVRVEDERAQRLREFGGARAGPAGDITIKAPMPGLVVEVSVAEGDSVAEHQSVVILEAMKMENELRAPTDGVIKAVRVEAGSAVDQNQVLVVLGPPEA